MPNAHLHLLLDAAKNEAELMAECPACGIIAIESFTSAWSKKFIACECGVTMEVAAEDLRQLRTMAAQYQRVIDDIVGAN